MQSLYDYGCTNDINARATFVGKIMPVFLPTLTFRKDGCSEFLIGEHHGAVSGDGSGIDIDENVEIACEYKCSIPKKTRVPNATTYLLPKYYTSSK